MSKVLIMPPSMMKRAVRVGRAVFVAPAGEPIEVEADLLPQFVAEGWRAIDPAALLRLRLPQMPDADDAAD